jgi:hypothetical protein
MRIGESPGQESADHRRTAITKRPNPRAAFLNIPYDEQFGDLYLAYIASLTAYGMTPRATLEIPGGARRLDRIIELIGSCRYSFHDLSRVEIDPANPPTPRFNMPFELGLAVAWDRLVPKQHVWFVLESVNRRALKSLSDLAGTDVYVHNGSSEGVFREIGNALVRKRNHPTAQDVNYIYAGLQAALPEIMKLAGSQSMFEARVFRQLLLAASELASKRLG